MIRTPQEWCRGLHVTGFTGQQLDVELPNVGHGSETVQVETLVADGEYLLVVLLGSHYCSRSRELVRVLSGRDDAFRRRATTVLPVLPDIRERARLWNRQYDLPFPMLADPAEDGDGTGEGPSGNEATFGVFEPLRDSVAALPAVALCRADETGLTVVATETEAALEVPVVESLLGFVNHHRTSDSAATPADS